MSHNKNTLQTDRFHDFIMHSKYLGTIRKLTKGLTHEYNNIFTGLAGQLRSKSQATGNGGLSKKQGLLVKDLLKRGIETTALLHEFSREVNSCKKPHPPERLAVKAITVLNTFSRRHHFYVSSATDIAKINVNHRDIILMLLYLGENAIEAMSEGGKITVEIVHHHKATTSSSVQFRMIDHGLGYSGEIKKSIYELFCTTEVENSNSVLGLYAVQTIVKDHGGTLTFEKSIEGETVAVVDIPSIGIKEKDIQKQPAAQERAPAKADFQKHVFLVVDDDAGMRDFLLNCLQRHDHIAFCAASCKEAVLKLHLLADVVTVVLVDIGLGDADGYDCTRQLRMIKEDICIILMSGSDFDLGIIKDLQAAFIQKPFSIDQLEQMLSDAKL